MSGFFLNMWIMKRIDEAYLQGQLEKNRINQKEYEKIIATPQYEG